MKDRIDLLLRERAGLIAEMRSMVDAAETRGSVTAEDRQGITRIETEISGLDERISNARKVNDLEGSLGERTQVDKPESRADSEADEYRKVFVSYVRDGVVDASQAKILQRGFVNEEYRDQTVGTAAKGGYLVPPGFEKTLIARAIEFSVMRQVVGSVTPMETATGNEITLPKEGGIGAAAWLDESAPFTESDDTFDEATLNAWKAGRLVKASLELIEDAFFDIESYLANSIGMAIGILESAAFVNGDGTRKPRGFLLDATSAFTSAAPATIASDEVLDLVYSVRPYYRASGKFVVSDDCVRILRKLKDSEGRYIWQDNSLNGLTTGAPATLAGYSVFTEVNMAAVAAGSKSIAFGDFSRYQIRDVHGARLARLGERYLADEGKIGYLGWHRTDGELLDTTAVKVITQHA